MIETSFYSFVFGLILLSLQSYWGLCQDIQRNFQGPNLLQVEKRGLREPADESEVCNYISGAQCSTKDCADALYYVLKRYYGCTLNGEEICSQNFDDYLKKLEKNNFTKRLNSVDSFDDISAHLNVRDRRAYIILITGHVFSLIFNGKKWFKCDASLDERPFGCKQIASPSVLGHWYKNRTIKSIWELSDRKADQPIAEFISECK